MDSKTPVWRKSSRSGAQAGGNCLEVATVPGRILVRDSKDPLGGQLDVSCTAWTKFLTSLNG